LNTPGRLSEAIPHFRTALRVKPDSAEIHNNLGGALSLEPGRLQDAIEEYRTALRLQPDNSEARDNLLAAGQQAFKNGDYATALSEFLALAMQGNPVAQNSLGVLYATGQGVAQDYKEAAKWYSLAASQGDTVAQSNLGFLYVTGQGVAQDYIQAHMWFNLAGAGGDSGVIKNRDIIARKMTPEQIAEAQRRAWEWKPKTRQ